MDCGGRTWARERWQPHRPLCECKLRCTPAVSRSGRVRRRFEFAQQQHALGRNGGDSLSPRPTAHQVRGLDGIVRGVHFPTDDLAAVQV